MSAAGDAAPKPLFEMMAGYNQWANRRIYEAVARLPDADYRADRGAFFGSLHGTLNHLLGTDRIWMRRFTGAGEAPSLDLILYQRETGIGLASQSAFPQG
ncbi:MAG: DinB family protein [Dongiaceae bacterium]